MKDQDRTKILTLALDIVLEAGKKRRSPYAQGAKIPWRTLDTLADAFREGGVQGIPDNLGAEARERVKAALERGHERYADVFGQQKELEL